MRTKWLGLTRSIPALAGGPAPAARAHPNLVALVRLLLEYGQAKKAGSRSARPSA